MRGNWHRGRSQLTYKVHPIRSLPSVGIRRRGIHDAAVPTQMGVDTYHKAQSTTGMTRPAKSPLSILPLTTLLRSFFITSLSSYPLLLTPSLTILSRMGRSSSPLLSPDRNPILHFLLKKTFYAQFCAGETPQEVRRTIRGLKKLGFRGVIMSHGKEVVLEKGQKVQERPGAASREFEETQEEKKHVEAWTDGTMKTVEMMEPGDYAAIKFSGAGNVATRQLGNGSDPTPCLEAAIDRICRLAEKNGVRLMVDAEQYRLQKGIHKWTLDLQRKYNKSETLIFDTYQTYLRSTPSKLAAHLQSAKQDGFTLGVKLVRGAYMASDPSEIFWESKQKTDQIFDGITEALLKGQWNETIQPIKQGSDFAPVDVVLATHNQESVRKALAIQEEQKSTAGKRANNVSYGQLMGMADEISCELLVANSERKQSRDAGSSSSLGVKPSAYKYLTWGSVQECLKYLVRRAQENRDAMVRAQHTRTELGKELLRRAGFSQS